MYYVRTAPPTSGAPLSDVESSRPYSPLGGLAHLYVHRPPPAAGVRLDVLFRVARFGFLAAATWITALIAAVVTVVAVALPAFHANTDAGGALLLVIPALGAGFVTQYVGHSMTTKMLTTVRRAVYLSSGIAVAACCLLVAGEAPAEHTQGHGWCAVAFWLWDRLLWLPLVVVSVALAMLTYLARRLPADEPARPTHRLLRALTSWLLPVLDWPRISGRR